MSRGKGVPKTAEHARKISEALKRHYGSGKKHPWTGRLHSEEWKANMRGENNPIWRGEETSYQAKHNWVARHRGRPAKCEDCGLEDENRRRYFNWANISGRYLRNLDDWKRLCVLCHRKYDKIKKIHA